MKFRSLASAPIVIGLLLIPGTAQAHHGWVDFDEKADLTVSGTVTAFYFVNPHCVVEFEVKDEKGQVIKWQGEFSNPGQLTRQGWTAASLQAGDKIMITGHPGKNNAPAIHVSRIRLPDGRDLKVEGGR